LKFSTVRIAAAVLPVNCEFVPVVPVELIAPVAWIEIGAVMILIPVAVASILIPVTTGSMSIPVVIVPPLSLIFRPVPTTPPPVLTSRIGDEFDVKIP